MREIKVEGFTSDIRPTDLPTVSVFSEEGGGKTRFGATAPGPIGLLPLDRKSRRTFYEIAKQLGKTVICPKMDYLQAKDAMKVSLLDASNGIAKVRDDKVSRTDLEETKRVYREVYKRVLDDANRLGDHPDIQSVVVDTNTQNWDWMMFSHFGRRSQIDTFQRAPVNQDMIDFINALKHKNLVLIHRAAEIWKNTGEIDAKGRPKQAPSGKLKSEGCSKLGYLITCELELISKPKADDLEEKFGCRIRECQTRPLIEGQEMGEYGLSGEGITWDNLMTVIGWED